MALADFDSNGFPDVVTANTQSGDVSVLLGTGDGTFLPPRSFAAGSGPYAVATGDLDRDVTQSYPLVIANQPGSVAVGDVTGDGKLDLVATGVDDMWVLEGRGDGTFGPSQRFAGGGDSVVLEDLDGNGTLDAVSIRGDVQVLPHL